MSWSGRMPQTTAYQFFTLNTPEPFYVILNGSVFWFDTINISDNLEYLGFFCIQTKSLFIYSIYNCSLDGKDWTGTFIDLRHKMFTAPSTKGSLNAKSIHITATQNQESASYAIMIFHHNNTEWFATFRFSSAYADGKKLPS